MSLINDALKRAQQNHSADETPPKPKPPIELRLKMAPPLPPPAHPPKSKSSRLVPAGAIFLIAAGLVAVGLATLRQPAHDIAVPAPEVAKNETPVAKTVAPVTAPVPAPAAPAVVAPASAPKAAPVVAPVEPEPAPPSNPVDAPKLQGIFYVPGKSSAIIDGKSVRAGDKISQYRVKEITKTSVTLVNANGAVVKLGMDH
jgi:hypothetical protein